VYGHKSDSDRLTSEKSHRRPTDLCHGHLHRCAPHSHTILLRPTSQLSRTTIPRQQYWSLLCNTWQDACYDGSLRTASTLCTAFQGVVQGRDTMFTSSSGHSALLVSRLGILVDEKYARFYYHVYRVDRALLVLTHLLLCSRSVNTFSSAMQLLTRA
jgi:hypothetical protein